MEMSLRAKIALQTAEAPLKKNLEEIIAKIDNNIPLSSDIVRTMHSRPTVSVVRVNDRIRLLFEMKDGVVRVIDILDRSEYVS